MTKQLTQSQRILEGLKTGPKTTAWFIDELRIFKYSSRIADLRKKGHSIHAKKLKPGLWEYTLISGDLDGAIERVVEKPTDQPVFGKAFCAEHKLSYPFGSRCPGCMGVKTYA